VRGKYGVNLVDLGGPVALGGPLKSEGARMQVRQIAGVSVVLKGLPFHPFLCLLRYLRFPLHPTLLVSYASGLRLFGKLTAGCPAELQGLRIETQLPDKMASLAMQLRIILADSKYPSENLSL
jgi:hypothetical protein